MTDAESGFRRQWRIYHLLSGSEGETLADLADRFEVSTKTITRDIATLRAVGLNVVEATEKFGLKRWRVEADTTKFPKLQWIYLGQRFFEPMAGSLSWEASQKAFAKPKATFTPEAFNKPSPNEAIWHRVQPVSATPGSARPPRRGHR